MARHSRSSRNRLGPAENLPEAALLSAHLPRAAAYRQAGHIPPNAQIHSRTASPYRPRSTRSSACPPAECSTSAPATCRYTQISWGFRRRENSGSSMRSPEFPRRDVPSRDSRSARPVPERLRPQQHDGQSISWQPDEDEIPPLPPTHESRYFSVRIPPKEFTRARLGRNEQDVPGLRQQSLRPPLVDATHETE